MMYPKPKGHFDYKPNYRRLYKPLELRQAMDSNTNKTAQDGEEEENRQWERRSGREDKGDDPLRDMNKEKSYLIFNSDQEDEEKPDNKSKTSRMVGGQNAGALSSEKPQDLDKEKGQEGELFYHDSNDEDTDDELKQKKSGIAFRNAEDDGEHIIDDEEDSITKKPADDFNGMPSEGDDDSQGVPPPTSLSRTQPAVFNRVGAYHVSQEGIEHRQRAHLPTQPERNLSASANFTQDENGQVVEMVPMIDGGLPRVQSYVVPLRQDDRSERKDGERRFCKLRFLIPILVLIVVAVIAIAVAVPLAMKTSSNNNDQTLQERQANVRSQILNVISSAQDLNDTSTPQYKAFEWITQRDDLSPIGNTSTTPQIQKLITRYVLAVFYYSLRGPTWLEQNGWLQGNQDECDWQFLSCSMPGDTIHGMNITSNLLKGFVPSELQHLSSLSKYKGHYLLVA